MRVAGVKTIEQANRYLDEEYLVWWERELTVEPANIDDAHRPLEKGHDLASSMSHVETRQVRNDCHPATRRRVAPDQAPGDREWVAWGRRSRGEAATVPWR